MLASFTHQQRAIHVAINYTSTEGNLCRHHLHTNRGQFMSASFTRQQRAIHVGIIHTQTEGNFVGINYTQTEGNLFSNIHYLSRDCLLYPAFKL